MGCGEMTTPPAWVEACRASPSMLMARLSHSWMLGSFFMVSCSSGEALMASARGGAVCSSLIFWGMSLERLSISP